MIHEKYLNKLVRIRGGDFKGKRGKVVRITEYCSGPVIEVLIEGEIYKIHKIKHIKLV